jgi:hypothetical protein
VIKTATDNLKTNGRPKTDSSLRRLGTHKFSQSTVQENRMQMERKAGKTWYGKRLQT